MLPLAEKLARILIEEDLYKNGEGDTLRSVRYDDIFYKITYSDGWWDLEKYQENRCYSKEAFQKLSRLVRHILTIEKIDY